ncbi:MAG: HD domain-containing phosphohydrolase [Armatimonadota bacterium]
MIVNNSESEVKSVVETWFNAYAEHDIDKARTLIDAEEETVFWGININGRHLGRTCQKTAMENEFASDQELVIRTPVISIKIYNNDMALVSVEALFVFTINDSYRQATVWHTMALRKKNNKWLITQIHMSSPFIEETEKNQPPALRYHSFHDPVMGIYNRLFFELELERLDTERQLPLSIIMGDVNCLKITNDAFGHNEGDRLLRTIAGIMHSVCRKEDIVARWGGDEIVILLPQTSYETAKNICKRITEKCMNTNSGLIKPNISLGVASRTNMSQQPKSVLKEAEELMYRNKLMEGRNARSYLISLIRKKLSENTYETDLHSSRLKCYAEVMSSEMQFPDSEVDALQKMALLHDIGEIVVPTETLMKPDELDDTEWNAIKLHPEIGYRIISAIPATASIADYIISHHERWDGGGYPQGLKGDDIPVASRVFALIDAYEAMTNERPYREAMSADKALGEIDRCIGTQFDPKSAQQFLKIQQSQRNSCT